MGRRPASGVDLRRGAQRGPLLETSPRGRRNGRPRAHALRLHTYTWYRSEDAGAGWTAWEVITGEVGSSYHVHHLDEHPYRFRVKVDFTPTSGVATTIGSQVITQSGNHDYAFSGTPDWTPWW
jgi:hypothetical protein